MPDLNGIRKSVPAKMVLDGLENEELALLYRALNTERNVVTLAIKKSAKLRMSLTGLQDQYYAISNMLMAVDDEYINRTIVQTNMRMQTHINSAKELT